MKKRIKVKNVIIAVLIFILLLFNIILGIFLFGMRKMDNKNTQKEVVISSGMTVDSILDLLIEEDLIRSKLFSKIYIKISGFNLQAGTYDLNTSMNTMSIIKNIANGKVTTKYNVNITFMEGLNVPQIARIIESKTNNKFDDVIKLLEDREFAKEMINTYWFLDESILNKSIYYPLEGYLFPNTYTFINKDVDAKTIIKTLLDEFNKKITPYKEKIQERGFKLRDVVIHASIAEAESLPGDRGNIVSVNMNRIKNYYSLGSDETAYYAYKQFEKTIGLTNEQFADCSNPYNTRCTSKMGLPIGPINNPGLDALVSTIEYKPSEYFYYVADCNCKTYFAKNDYEIGKIIRDLSDKGLWCEVSS